MDYKEREVIDALKLTINQFKVPVQKRFKKADDANKLWNAALLFSKVVKESKPFTRLFSRGDFEEFTNQYNLKYSTNIDGPNLFKKFWLREVLGFVYITDAVRVVTNDYEKYNNLKNEVFFLRCLFQNYPEKTIEKSVFAETVRLYEVENDLKISEEWMANTNWVKPSIEEDILKIGNVDYLFNLLDNWNDFAFLHTFKKQFQKRQERKFEIDSKILTQTRWVKLNYLSFNIV
ncbi:MAG: hypothetical protein CVU03_08790 [Bacteroidetes bacterium HGW-Bacteroidetes-2]|jgi:hypothetical protein|nr:MAG: hypothetical protein CVU03_08790 [Bacteroidetes bacterium HGW-Bacteroidetes-2]